MTTPAAWHPDPSGIFDHRYWDGTRWTQHVAVRGVHGTSPVHADPGDARRTAASLAPAPPVPATVPAPSPAAAVPVTAAPPAAPAPAPAPASEAYAITLPARTVAGGPLAAGPPTGPMLGGMPPAARTPAPGRSHDGWLWVLVAVPVLLGLVQLAAEVTVALLPVLVVAAAVGNVGAALLDMRANPAITARDSTAVLAVAAVLLAPLYVFLRQRRLGRSQLPLLGYLVVAAVMTALPLVLTAARPVIDEARLEGQIETWVRDSFDTEVTVDCPAGQPATAGHRFLCEATDAVGSARVRVEVLNRAGDVEWVVLG